MPGNRVLRRVYLGSIFSIVGKANPQAKFENPTEALETIGSQ
jgi:hypothetical protein